MGIREICLQRNYGLVNKYKLNFKRNEVIETKPEKTNSKKLWLALGGLASLGVSGVMVYKYRNAKFIQEIKSNTTGTFRKMKTKADDAVTNANAKADDVVKDVKTKVEKTIELTQTTAEESLIKKVLPEEKINKLYLKSADETVSAFKKMKAEAENMLETSQKIADEVNTYPKSEMNSIGILSRNFADKKAFEIRENVIGRITASDQDEGMMLEVLDQDKVIRRVYSVCYDKFLIKDFNTNLLISVHKDGKVGEVKNLLNEKNHMWVADNAYVYFDKTKALNKIVKDKDISFHFVDKNKDIDLDGNGVIERFLQRNDKNQRTPQVDMFFKNGSPYFYKAGEDINNPEKTDTFVRIVGTAWKEFNFKDGEWLVKS